MTDSEFVFNIGYYLGLMTNADSHRILHKYGVTEEQIDTFLKSGKVLAEALHKGITSDIEELPDIVIHSDAVAGEGTVTDLNALWCDEQQADGKWVTQQNFTLSAAPDSTDSRKL